MAQTQIVCECVTEDMCLQSSTKNRRIVRSTTSCSCLVEQASLTYKYMDWWTGRRAENMSPTEPESETSQLHTTLCRFTVISPFGFIYHRHPTDL